MADGWASPGTVRRPNFAPQLPEHAPRNVILFGAGASFGSDPRSSRRIVPPLGNGLFPALLTDPRTPSWKQVPAEVRAVFLAQGFEQGMSVLLGDDELAAPQMRRDWELGRYFSQFQPRSTNVYHVFAKGLRRARERGWSGALITLNYERLLELALLKQRLFPVVTGAEFYDDTLPIIPRKQLIELQYPHGACHLVLGFSPFDLSRGGNVVLRGEVRGGGVHHLLVHEHIAEALDRQCLLLICRYDPQKSSSFRHAFFEAQRRRVADVLSKAETIAIVGAFCAHDTDQHLWNPIGESAARITYVDPVETSIATFEAWAQSTGRTCADGYRVLRGGFSDLIAELLQEFEAQASVS